MYLRARYYVPALGVFPSLDPVEEGNRYGYVGGNVANRIDPSGECYFNSKETTSQERVICWETWQNYVRVIEQEWGPLSSWEALSNQVDCEGRFWGQFTFSDFTALWSDPDFAPPCGGAQQPFVGAFIGVQPVHTVGADPASALLFLLAGLCVSNAASIIEKLGLPSSSIHSGVVLPARPTLPARAYEYRLSGFDAKVGTLAEHLAKLLEYDVAGYPPSDPNPNRDPDGGWCRTIRRVIQEIDSSGYSQKQLNRDLETAGFGGNRWLEVVNAVKEVVRLGLCKDHWGGFGGGSLGAG